MTNRLLILGVILLSCVIVSCSRVPKHIISEKNMRTVLYDMHIAEALVETKNDIYRTIDDRQGVYDAVFKKHNITQSEYDSSLVWYGKNVDLYMDVYNLVLNDIKANVAALGDIKASSLPVDVSSKDSIDIWADNRNYTFDSKNVFNTLLFNTSPIEPYSSGSSFVLGLSIWGISPDFKHKPKIHISAVHADTIISINKELDVDGYYETIIRTVATKQVLRVYGYITVNNAEASYHRIYLNNINLMKYNYGSNALTAPQDPSEMKSEE